MKLKTSNVYWNILYSLMSIMRKWLSSSFGFCCRHNTCYLQWGPHGDVEISSFTWRKFLITFVLVNPFEEILLDSQRCNNKGDNAILSFLVYFQQRRWGKRQETETFHREIKEGREQCNERKFEIWFEKLFNLFSIFSRKAVRKVFLMWVAQKKGERVFESYWLFVNDRSWKNVTHFFHHNHRHLFTIQQCTQIKWKTFSLQVKWMRWKKRVWNWIQFSSTSIEPFSN